MYVIRPLSVSIILSISVCVAVCLFVCVFIFVYHAVDCFLVYMLVVVLDISFVVCFFD